MTVKHAPRNVQVRNRVASGEITVPVQMQITSGGESRLHLFSPPAGPANPS